MNSFYARHSCGKKGIFRINGNVIEHDVFMSQSWWDICYECKQPIKMEDLTLLHPGVEIVSYPHGYNHPEWQGTSLECNLQIDGVFYIFLSESSGNRGTYAQWVRTWVTSPTISTTGEWTMPAPYKCGTRYWNDHCWLTVGGRDGYPGFKEAIEIVRSNSKEIARRAADSKYHAG